MYASRATAPEKQGLNDGTVQLGNWGSHSDDDCRRISVDGLRGPPLQWRHIARTKATASQPPTCTALRETCNASPGPVPAGTRCEMQPSHTIALASFDQMSKCQPLQRRSRRVADNSNKSPSDSLTALPIRSNNSTTPRHAARAHHSNGVCACPGMVVLRTWFSRVPGPSTLVERKAPG